MASGFGYKKTRYRPFIEREWFLADESFQLGREEGALTSTGPHLVAPKPGNLMPVCNRLPAMVLLA